MGNIVVELGCDGFEYLLTSLEWRDGFLVVHV